jgi:hypothetical protein
MDTRARLKAQPKAIRAIRHAAERVEAVFEVIIV